MEKKQKIKRALFVSFIFLLAVIASFSLFGSEASAQLSDSYCDNWCKTSWCPSNCPNSYNCERTYCYGYAISDGQYCACHRGCFPKFCSKTTEGCNPSAANCVYSHSYTYQEYGTCPCNNPITCTVKVYKLETPSPTVSLSASPSTIIQGDSSRLTWSSTNASSCQWTGGLSGSAPTSGNRDVSPGSTTTYTIRCDGAGGNASRSATVSVYPPVTVSLTANPSSVVEGDSSRLTWSSTNASSCQWTGGLSGSAPTSGNRDVSPTQLTTYSIRCSNPADNSSDSATVTVIPRVTVSLSASPSTIIQGDSSRLTWSSTNASSCQWTGGLSGSAPTSGNRDVSPGSTTTYTIRCDGPGSGNNASRSTAVNVIPLHDLRLFVVGSGGINAVITNPSGTGTCPANCEYKAVDNTMVRLESVPGPDHIFSIWQMGPCEGQTSSQCNFRIDRNETATAYFVPEIEGNIECVSSLENSVDLRYDALVNRPGPEVEFSIIREEGGLETDVYVFMTRQESDTLRDGDLEQNTEYKYIIRAEGKDLHVNHCMTKPPIPVWRPITTFVWISDLIASLYRALRVF